MSGADRAEARLGRELDRDLDPEAQADEGLAESRGRLKSLAEHLDKHDKNAGTDERYWFYEYLRQLHLKMSNLLEELEGRLQPPIEFDDVVEQLIQPLEEIHDDLRKYYWKPRGLLEQLAVSDVDKALLKTTDEIRKDWGLLASAVREYVAARQGLEPEEATSLLTVRAQTPERPEVLLATGDTFYLRLLAFVKLLAGIVTHGGFTIEHSRLARLLRSGPSQQRADRQSRSRSPTRHSGDTEG